MRTPTRGAPQPPRQRGTSRGGSRIPGTGDLSGSVTLPTQTIKKTDRNAHRGHIRSVGGEGHVSDVGSPPARMMAVKQ
jgi:hypothetical protein